MRYPALCCALALALSCVCAALGCATGNDTDRPDDDDDGGAQGQGGAGGAGSGEGGSLLSTSSAGGDTGCDPDENCGICGNGTTEMGEECDDGNTTPGDGCDATCKIEEPAACNPDGVYTISPVSYSCCSGLVTVNVSSFLFTAGGAQIATSPSNAAPMTGSPTTCPAGSFINTGSLAGGCTETYTLNGSFTGEDTWTGTYSVTFTGADCDCFGGMLGTPCISQTYPVTATRQ